MKYIKVTEKLEDIDYDDEVFYYFEKYIPSRYLYTAASDYYTSTILEIKDLDSKPYNFDRGNVNISKITHFKIELNKFLRKIVSITDEEWLILSIPSSNQSLPLKEEKYSWNSLDMLISWWALPDDVTHLNGKLIRKYNIPPKHLNPGARNKMRDYDSLMLTENFSVKNRNIILVDDIVTSGTSFSAAKQFLDANGANKVICVSLSKTTDPNNTLEPKETSIFALALLKICGIGPSKIKKFVLKNDKKLDKCVSNINTFLTNEQINEFNKVKNQVYEEINENINQGIKLITIFDEEFPETLYNQKESCIFLYYKGNINLLKTEMITILGSNHFLDKDIYYSALLLVRKINQAYTLITNLPEKYCFAHYQLVKNSKTILVTSKPIWSIENDKTQNFMNTIISNDGLVISEYGNLAENTSNDDKPAKDWSLVNTSRLYALLSQAAIAIDTISDDDEISCIQKMQAWNKKVFQLANSNSKIVDNLIDPNKQDVLDMLRNEINK